MSSLRREVTSAVPILEVNNLTKMYGGLAAVRDVSLAVEPGEIVGMIGPNGAGKTTTFEVVTGFQPATEGTIRFKGEVLNGLLPHEVARRGVGRTFQIIQPFPMFSALENVMVAAFMRYPSRAAAERKAWEVLHLVGMEGKAHFLAKNLTLADNKRLEIGRALATDAEMILLDEVMAGLTPVEADQAIALVLRLNKDNGITFLVIEHVMHIIMSISQRIVVLHHGEKISEGKPDEVVHDPKVIEAYLGEEVDLA